VVEGDESCEVLDYSLGPTRYARRVWAWSPPEDAQMPPCAGLRGVQQRRPGHAAGLMARRRRGSTCPATARSPVRTKGIDGGARVNYGKLGELTGGSFRADLIETQRRRQGHVTAVHQNDRHP